MAYNLGNAYINVIPSMKGGGKALAKEFSGVSSVGSKAGRSLGAAMRKAFVGSAPLDLGSAQKQFEAAQAKLATSAEKSAQRQKRAQEDVAAARQRLADVATRAGERVESTAARVAEAEQEAGRAAERAAQDQEAAKRKVEIAQAKYNETLRSHAPESAKALAAADQLARAEENLERVTTRGSDAQAKAKQKVADAQEQYAQAVKDAGEDSDAAKAAADNLRIAEQKLEGAAADAAEEHRRLSAEVDEAARSLDKAQRSSGGMSKVWDGVKSAGAGYKGIGDQINAAIGPKLWNGLKVGAVGAGAAVAGAFTGSLVKGFNRLRDIENAEAQLAGLGHSADSVSAIMENALSSVKGTAFGLGDAAGLAGTLVASGIKPGEDLERVLALTADSATIAGRELGDMGLIWGSVAAKGKLQGDDAMQLLSSGVPIWQMVADVMGVTAAEAQELGSKGEVSFDIFAKAMEQGVGGAAQASGKTTEGAFKNMGAAMGRFGAALLEDVYPLFGPLMGKVTDFFDYLTDAAGPVMETISGKMQEFGKGIKGVWDILVNGDFTGAENLFGFEEDSGFVTFLFGVRDVAKELYDRVLKPIGSWVGENWKVIATVLGGMVAFFAGASLVSAIGAVGTAIGALFGALNWIAIGVSAAVGAVAAFFTQTEAGRGILDRLVSFVRDTLVPGIVTAFEAVKNFIVEELWPMIKSRFEAIRDLAVQVWQGVIQPAFEQFVGFLRDTMFPIIQRLWQEYIQPAFMAIGALAVWLWENAIKPAWSAFNDFLTNVLGPVIVWLWQNVVSPIFGLIGSFIGWVWDTLIFPYLDVMKYYFTVVLPAVFKFLWEVAKQVWSGISAAISATVDWITGTAVPFIKAAWDLIAGSAKWLWGVFVTVWNGIKGAVAAVVGWFRTWVWPVLEMVIKLIQIGFNGLRDALHTAWMYIRDSVIKPVVSWFQNTAWPLIRTVIEAIKLGFNLMRDALKAAWQFVKNSVIAPVVNWFKNTAWPLLRTAIDAVKLGFNVMRDSLKRAWQFVKNNIINPVVTWFRDTVKPMFDRVLDGIKTAFNNMRDSLKRAWDFVKNNIINPVVTWFRDTVKPLIDRVTDGIEKSFDTMKDSIGKSWDAVKQLAKAPIKFVVETVLNNALIGNFNKLADKLGTSKLPTVQLPSGFARGGILPGMSRMRDGDDQLVPMRRGEGVLVSEGLRTARDRAAFMAANAAGRRGIGFASLMQGGFAKGGILGRAWEGVKGAGRAAKDLAGDALDKVLEGVDFVAEAIKDPKSIFTKVYDAVIGNIPGAGLWIDMAKSTGKKVLDGVVNSVLGAFVPDGSQDVGPMPAGASQIGRASCRERV